MAKSRRSRRPRTVLILAVLAALTIITLDARGGFHRVTSGLRSVAADAIAPVRSGVNAITEPIGNFLAGAVHYGAVEQQNEKLRAEIANLKMAKNSQADNTRALAQLSALLNLPFVDNLQTVPAEVIDYNSSNFAATIQISVGRADGVQLNMPVVGGGGLVGQVVQANHHTATVRLITDGQSVVGVRYGTGGDLATLDGQGWGLPLSADLVPSSAELHDGEVFTTSGLQGAAFPAGIPVARVVRTRSSSAATQESVTLVPTADLENLRYVSVLLWGPET